MTLIKEIYEDTKCTVQIGGQLTDFFPVKVGVRQGCIMSPTLFNIFLDYIMREIKCLDEHLDLNSKMVTDIRYADDTTFISAVFEKLQLATSQLVETCAKWGLKINPNKCAVLTNTENNQIEIDGNPVPNVDQFKFLGSIVPECSKDIKSRISMASQAFGRLYGNRAKFQES